MKEPNKSNSAATEIELTPNYQQLYEQFKREALIQSSNLFNDMPLNDGMDIGAKKDAMRGVQYLLAAINVALQSATTIANIQDMRVWLGNIVADIDSRAAMLEADLDGDYDGLNEIENSGPTEPLEPEECDWITTDHITFYEHGRPNCRFDVGDDWRTDVKARMEKDQFWPNVWMLSDHGNWHLLSLEGGK